MSRAYLALGSNIGDKAANLRAALERLEDVPGVRLVATSAIYRTPPWGKLDQDWFANAVAAVDTSLPPEALLDAALDVERALGRTRDERWGPRIIDIDLLIHGEARRSGGRLTLPHPAITDRAFVLVPLAEIAPGLMLNGTSLEAHLARLDRNGIEPMASFAVEAEPA